MKKTEIENKCDASLLKLAGKDQEGISKGCHTSGKANVAMGSFQIWLDNVKTLCYLSDGLPEFKANAARIVTCWNEYDQLKLDNERLQDQLGTATLPVMSLSLEVEILTRKNKELLEALSEIIKWDGSASWSSHIDTVLVKKAKEAINNNTVK